MFLIDDLLFWGAVAVLAAGMVAVACVAAWTLCTVADWVFGLFKERDEDASLVMSNQVLIESVSESIRKKDDSLADKLDAALEDTGSKLVLWQKDEMITELQILSARDTSVDELGDITRFDRNEQIRVY